MNTAIRSQAGQHVVLAITGASGSAYALRLSQVLLRAGLQLHVVVSEAARQVLLRELRLQLPRPADSAGEWQTFFSEGWLQGAASDWGFRPLPSATTEAGQIHLHGINNYAAGIASGSFRTRGMVICPCSMGTLSSVACGASTNLIQRAADVHLKERRPLILVPRETPLGLIALENMARLTQAGAVILPAMPGFYLQPATIGDLVDFVVARICDHLQIDHQLTARWGE